MPRPETLHSLNCALGCFHISPSEHNQACFHLIMLGSLRLSHKGISQDRVPKGLCGPGRVKTKIFGLGKLQSLSLELLPAGSTLRMAVNTLFYKSVLPPLSHVSLPSLPAPVSTPPPFLQARIWFWCPLYHSKPVSEATTQTADPDSSSNNRGP